MAGEEALDGGMALIFDDERYKKAAALHASLSTPPTLQDLCSMSVCIINGNAVVTEWKKSGKNIFEQLPNNLKIDLLNYVLSRYHVDVCKDRRLRFHFYELTNMLMNHATVMMDFRRCSWQYTSVDEFREILTNAAGKCPKLENFAVKGDDKYHEDGFIEAEDAISPRSGIGHLLRLENLRHLEINRLWYWTDHGLIQLFSHLKNLVVLKLLIHASVTVSGFQNIHLLKDLEQFHFQLFDLFDAEEDDGSSVFEWVYSYCAENVPSLKLIGGELDTEERKKDGYFRDNFYDLFELTDISPRISGTSMLEYLHTRWILPSADFPNLRHLYFRGPVSMCVEKFHQKVSSFANLNYLYLAGLTYNVVVEVLEFVGEQLASLNVDVEDKMDFFQMLHLCPNLTIFKQHYLNIRDDATYVVVCPSKYQSLVTKHNVRLLEVVKLLFDRKGTNGLLELILFAPLLENFELFCLSISKAECQMVQDMPEGNFPCLSGLSLWSLDLDPFCSLNDFGLFVQCLVCCAPRLRVCYFAWKNDYLTKKWDSEQIVVQSYLQLL